MLLPAAHQGLKGGLCPISLMLVLFVKFKINQVNHWQILFQKQQSVTRKWKEKPNSLCQLHTLALVYLLKQTDFECYDSLIPHKPLISN